MQKKKAGFSYVEALAAGALFVIILLGVLPLTLGARQNLAFAQENRRLSLAATSLSLAVRDLSLSAQSITNECVKNLARGLGIKNYSVFIYCSKGIGSHFHSSEDGENVSLTGLVSLTRGQEGRLVYVVVRNDFNTLAGSAISIAVDFNNTTGIWRNARG